MVTMSTLPGRAILGGLLLEMKFVLCTEWFPPPLSPPVAGDGWGVCTSLAGLLSNASLDLYQFCPHRSGIECYLH